MLHSPSEFVIDFGKILPGADTAVYIAGVMMAPATVKEFIRSLQIEVGEYEKLYGDIITPEDIEKARKRQADGRSIGFRSPDDDDYDSDED